MPRNETRVGVGHGADLSTELMDTAPSKWGIFRHVPKREAPSAHPQSSRG